MFDYERFRNDVLALGLLALVVFVGLSFLSYDPSDPPSDLVFPARRTPINICGSTGASIAFYSRHLLGAGVWMVMASMVAWDLNLFSRQKPTRNWLSLAGTVLFVFSSSTAMHLLMPNLNAGSTYGSGGVIGAWSGLLLHKAFSPAGVTILVMCGILSGWMLSPLWGIASPGARLATLPLSVMSSLASVARAFRPAQRDVVVRKKDAEEDEPVSATPERFKLAVHAPEAEPETDSDPSEEPMVPGGKGLRINPPVSLTLHAEDATLRRQYNLPDLSLLEEPEDFPYELLAQKARIAAATLEKTFQQFGLNITVSEVDTGPAVTQFELDLEPGLRLNKVTALEDDLAIALRVPAVRVVAPIPGKNTVGVEVPNEKQVTVRLKELIQSCGAKADDFRIPLFFGKDVSGHALAVDLAKMPHLLIAGRTG
ncbi:MAG: DNA translocase FtsK 4TM domain-containing protein, partial [Planctomycetaceae bacterium]